MNRPGRRAALDGATREHASRAFATTRCAVTLREVRSPGDETWHKLPFYAAHHVDEVLIVDPAEQTVTWLGLRGGEYEPVGHSGLIELGPSELAAQVDWP